MPRERRPVDRDLQDVIEARSLNLDPVEQLTEALEELTPGSTPASFKVPTLNSNEEVELFRCS